MGFDYETGGDLSNGGQWLSEPGTYHLMITDVDEQPTNKDGALIDNAAFRVNFSVCDGTVPGQVDKAIDITFFRPKPTDKNEGAFAKKKIDRFLVAVGLLTEQQVIDKWKGKIELQESVGRQLVAKLDKEKEDSKFLSLSFADIFHVDDPAVATIPRSKDHLALIDPKLRRIASGSSGTLTPAKGSGRGKGKAATAASAPATPAAPTAAPAPAFDMSDV